MNSLRERKKKKKQWKGKIKKLVEHLLMNLVFLLAVPASKSRNPSSWKTRVGSRSSRSNCFSRIRPILIHYGRDTTGWRRPSRSLPPLMLQQYGYEIFDRNLYFDIVIDSFKQQILARLFLCLVTSVSINCCRYFVSSFYHDWNWSSPPLTLQTDASKVNTVLSSLIHPDEEEYLMELVSFNSQNEMFFNCKPPHNPSRWLLRIWVVKLTNIMLATWIRSVVLKVAMMLCRNEVDGLCGGRHRVAHVCEAPNRRFIPTVDASVGTKSSLSHPLGQIFDDVRAVSSTSELVERVEATDSNRRETNRPRNQPIAVFQKYSGRWKIDDVLDGNFEAAGVLVRPVVVH